jgi:adenylate cyclase
MTFTELRSNIVPCIPALRHKPMAVMFVDLDNFMRLCTAVPAEHVFTLIEEFQRLVTDTVSSFNGEVYAYQGDGVLATFGKLAGRADCATRALRCAWKCLERIGALNLDQAIGGDQPISASIGLQYGELCVGTIGVSKRFGQTLIGDAMNVAVRLERHAHALGTRIVAGNELMQRARCEGASSASELAKFMDAGPLSVGGRGEPVNVWVADQASEVSSNMPRKIPRKVPRKIPRKIPTQLVSA